VLALPQTLRSELGPRGIYVQAVLPAATRTEIWERSGRNVDTLALMDVNERVDAALVVVEVHYGRTLSFMELSLHGFPSNQPGRQDSEFDVGSPRRLPLFNTTRRYVYD